MSKKITYFGQPIEAYNKSEYVKKFFEGLKEIINNRNLNKNGKENAIQELFKRQFTPIQDDIKEKLQRLIYENQLQRTNIENKNINAEMLQIAQSLNAYSNNLLNFYGNSYFEMTNSGERKKFIRDLRFLLSTFGMVQQALGNVVYGENRITNSNIRNAVSNKSSLVQAYEKKDREKKSLMKPSNGSASGTFIRKEEIQESNKNKLLSNQFLESNLLNNANNCYRNSVIHILYTLLSKEGEAAFASPSNPYMEMKSNLKNFLVNYVTKKEVHPQGILNTYNPFISVISDYSKDSKEYFVIDDYVFKLKNTNSNTYINNIQELYTYYPTLNGSIKSANDFYDAFRTNLINNFTIEKGPNQAFRNDFYFDKIINSIYKSYGNAQMYLYDLLHNKENAIFKTDFLNKLNVNSASTLSTYMTTLYYESNIKIPSLNSVVSDAQSKFNFAPVAASTKTGSSPVNEYILISVGDMHHFDNYDFDKLYLINNHYYQLSDIVYASGGHYISVNMREGKWYKYDDMTPSAVLLDGNNFNLEASGFYPNIFLFINTKVSPTVPVKGGAKVKSKKVKKDSKVKKVKKNSKDKKVKKISKVKKVKSKK